MAEATIMGLTVVCQSFPEIIEPQIPRDNILNTIDTIFKDGTELIVVEGAEGIGKTTILAQFSMRYPDNALSLFIKPTSVWTYDPEILRFDLCNQIQWALSKELLEEPKDVDDTFLRYRLPKLQRRARSNREFFYFVVDGLHDIPEEDKQIRKLILDMLPLGLSGFRFLLSGDFNQLSVDIPKDIRVKPFPLPSFTLDETVRYMEELKIDRQSVEEIHRTCQGIPGHLASVRRILQSGIDVQTFIEEMPDKLPDLFEIEWRRIKTDDDRQLKLLAILAHDCKRHSIDYLAHLLGVELATTRELLQDLGFVSIDSHSGEVSFVSEAFRKFAAGQLRDLKQEVYELLINDLLGDQDSEEALTYLPGYLEQARRFEDLLNYLSPDHFEKMLECSQSLVPVQQKAELGVNIAKRLGKDGDLMRFSTQRSAMVELDGAKIWRSEIEARIALNEYESAFALAQSTILKEDRLHLLAVIAKTKREQGLSPEPELMEQIRQLYNQINLTTLGERAIEIASDLIYSNPDLAIGMVEKSTNAEEGENALDWAFAKLSIVALGVDREKIQPTDIIENIRSRIKDPKARHFSAAVSLLLEEYSAAEVIAEVEKLEGVSYRLFLLRQWAIENRKRNDAAEVVDYALKLAISTTEYAPNARVYREIATPLPFVSDESKAKQLVSSFDSQKGTIEPVGPTEDYVRLQLLLAQTESKYNLEAACNRVIDVYSYISDLDDLVIKAGCMARLVASLTDIDPKMKLEPKEGIHGLTQDNLKSDVKQLLSSTAEQYHATRGIVRALAKTKPDMALEFAVDLNTENRRDLALLELVDSALRVPVSNLDLHFLEKSVIDRIVDTELRDEALLKVIERLSAEHESLEPLISEVFSLVNRIKDIREADERCRACCLAYSFLIRQNNDECSKLASHLLHKLSDAWQAIDVGWDRVDIGFKVTEALAERSLEKARTYLDLAEKARDNIIFDARTTASTYLACVRLTIRAYSGLLPKNIDTKEDMERLAELINRIPSNGERVGLWSELALRCYINGRSEYCKRIVAEYVKPLLRNLPIADAGYRDRVIITASPALYCAHKVTALEQISELPRPQRDKAYEQVCEFILRKQPPFEPYDALPGQGYDVTYEEIVDICELLNLMEHDAAIYHFIECISDSLVSRRLRNRFSLQQKSDIVNRLEGVINRKLPNPRHIKHDGYKIAAQAQIARIQGAGRKVWMDLIDSARKIPNLADRALVLCIIAVAMRGKEASKRKELLEEAKELIEQIPATLDKIERYESLASMVLDTDSAMSKECLKLAMKSTVESDSSQPYSVQRRIIDLAHRIDSNLASSLASLADDDPARGRIRTSLKRRLQILDLKKKMADQLMSGVDSTSSKSGYSSAAWMLLGALNADKIGTFRFNYTRDFVQIAATLPISQSYPILAWVIENAKKRHANTEQAGRYLRPIYEATLLGAELAERMAERSSIQLKKTKRYAAKPSDSESVLIRAGDRGGAIQYLRDWFESEVRDYLKICDPYFGLEDLEVLQLLRSVNPTCKVQILTSKKHQDNEGIPTPWEEAYRTHWRVRISDQAPPYTEIVIAGTESGGVLPIHDRWWLTKKGGIRVGTSFNSLGIDKASEISKLSEKEAEILDNEVDRYLQRIEQEHKGERLLYTLFTL